MKQMSPEMRSCIDECLHCYQILPRHGLGPVPGGGGMHMEPTHLRLMMACTESYRTSAHFMLIGLPKHKHTCRACAEVSEACAKSCEQVDDMQDCAESCRKMAA